MPNWWCVMSSERAGVRTRGHLDRDRVIYLLWEAYDAVPKGILDALEACVVPDPRLTRIEALLDEWSGSTRSRITPDFAAHEVRAILRGNE